MLHSERHPHQGLLISLAISICLLAGLFTLQGELEPGFYINRLGWPLLRIMAFIGIGLVVGELIESTGWTRYLAWAAGPMFRFARLGPRCSAAFTSAFFSGVTANAMLMNAYSEGRIGKEQLFLTNFINHLPAFFLHLPTTLFIILPLAGTAGLIYLLLVFASILLRIGFFLLLARLRLPGEAGSAEALPDAPQKKPWPEILRALRRKLPRRYGRIAQFVIPIYIGVSLLKALGGFDIVRAWLAGSAATALMPVESLSMVAVAFLADYTSGFATAGALLDNGVLTIKQGVIALIAGQILAFPLRALRHQLPRYLGIFSPKMGTQILLLGQASRVLSLLGVAAAYFTLA
jgi:hypothetical protein